MSNKPVKLKPHYTERCRLCDTVVECVDDMFRCRNKECKLHPILFTESEWFDVCPPRVSSHSHTRNARRRRLDTKHHMYFKPYVGMRGIVRDAAAMRGVSVSGFCRLAAYRAALLVHYKDEYQHRNQVIKDAMDGKYDLKH